MDATARIDQWCAAQSDHGHADVVRTGASFRGNTVIIEEQRSDWGGSGEWSGMPSARMRFDPATGRWDLAWHRASGRWEAYPDWVPSSLERCLQEIAEDPLCVFWG